MLRLTVRCQTPEQAVLEVDGWVTGEEVSLLAAEGTRLLGQSRRLVLELKGVMFIDAEGVALLQGWPEGRLALRDGPPFVRTLLARHGLRCQEGGEKGR
jgi:hypothetical protein